MTELVPTATDAAFVNRVPSVRWRVAGAAVLTHLCLGSVYAWSMFVAPIREATGWSQPQVTWAFSTAIASLGLTAALGGRMMQRMGPRRCVALSAVLFALGMAGAGFAIAHHSLALLYLLFGVIGGMGLGLGYAPPVAALMKWFPDRRGLATGMAVCGFGLGALVATKVAEPLLPRVGCSATFYCLASAYLLVLFAASQMLRLPPENWQPEGWVAPTLSGKAKAEFTTAQALSSSRFWLLWGVFFINISAGIMLIALAKPMSKEMVHLTEAQAGWLVAIMGLFNGTGRLGWSAASDRLGRFGTLAVMLILQVCLFALLAHSPSPWLFMGSIWLILSCYGGGFAITPACIADQFGSRNAGAIYGAALTAWGAAALLSPPVGAYLRELTQSFTGSLYVSAGLLVTALVMNLLLALQTRRTNR